MGGKGGVWTIPPSLKHLDHTIKLDNFNTVILKCLFKKPKELLARRCAIFATFPLAKDSMMMMVMMMVNRADI